MKVTTIIPALIDSMESENLLEKTIDKIPDSFLILITQGKKPASLEFKQKSKVLWLHSEKPLSKWEAIRRCQKELSEEDGIVALLDADDPIERDSISTCYNYALKVPDECVLGRRTKINLPANDAFSNKTRFFLEIFSNSLLLSILGKDIYYDDNPPDIQNCLYILNSSVFRKINLNYIGNYGGELSLFYELSHKNIKINNIDITPLESKSSNYNIDSIIKGIMGLPFISEAKEADFHKAKILAPTLYKSYFIKSNLRKKYWEEIDFIINQFNKYLR